MPPTPAAGPKDGLVLTGVVMEVAADGRPATVVGGLTVRISAAGIAVEGPGDAAGRTVPWRQVEGARCGEPGFLQGGAPAVAISAVVGGRPVRWLVPGDQLPPDRAVAVDTLLVARSAVDRLPPYWAPEPLRRSAPAPGTAARATPLRGKGAPGAASTAPRTAEDPEPSTDDEPVVAPVFRSSASRRPDGSAGVTSGPQGVAPPAPPAPGHGPAGSALDARSQRTLLAALWTLLVLLVALAAMLGVGLARQSSPSSAPEVPTASSDRLLAVELNLTKADFPRGWKVDPSATGPLTGFLSVGAGTPNGGLADQPSATATQRRQEAVVGEQFSRCMDVAASKDRVLGAGGPAPVARDGSPAFAGPSGGPPMEAGSVTAVYARAGAVAAALAQVSSPRFPRCFGEAVATQVQLATDEASKGSGTTYGAPTVRPLVLPQAGRVRAAGVDLDFPVKVEGAAATVQLGFVFVGAGRVESTLFTFGTVTGFPSTLTSRLAATVEHAIARRPGRAQAGAVGAPGANRAATSRRA